MKKIKYILLALIGVLLLVSLTSCGNKVKPVALFTSVHKTVFEQQNPVLNSYYNENNELKANLEVYRVYSDGKIEQIFRGGNGFSQTINETKDNNIKEVIIKDLQNQNITTSFNVVINSNNVSKDFTSYVQTSFDRPDSLYVKPNLSKPQDYIGNKPQRLSYFLYNKGYSFDFSLVNQKQLQLKIITNEMYTDPNTNTSKYKAVEKDLNESQINSFKNLGKPDQLLNKDNKPENNVFISGNNESTNENYNNYINALYNVNSQKTYKLFIPIKLQNGKIVRFKTQVIVEGGYQPVDKKTFNWFDYITVSWMAFFMSLLSFGGYFGLGILFFTILIRTILWPIYAKSTSMGIKMENAKPEIARMQKKYAGKTDKQSLLEMRQEQQRIYKKHKIGMSTMLLPFIQMPIFIGVYNTVRYLTIPNGYYSSHLTHTDFLGISLTQGKNWVNFLLAAIVGVTMMLSQLISMYKPKLLRDKKNDNTVYQDKRLDPNKSRRTMLFVMIGMTAFMVYLSISDRSMAFYWIIGNIYQVFQTSLYKYKDYKRQLKKRNGDLL